MLAKLGLSAVLVAGTFCANAFGQQTQFERPGVTQTAYTFQDKSADGDDNAQLKSELERMKLRLRELEIDVEKKLASQPEESKKAEKQEAQVEQRLKMLEACCEDQVKSLGKLTDAAPEFVVSNHKSPKLTVFGRIHLDYWSFPKVDDTLFPLEAVPITNPSGNPQDRIGFRRIRLGVKGNLNDNMFYKFQGEFAGVESSYRDVYLGFENLPFLNTVIIGNHKRPYGLDALNSSNYNVFLERPFIVEALSPDVRRLGISSNGVSEDQSWNWRIGVFNQELTQNQGVYIGDNYQAEFVARIARTAWYDESSGGRGYAHMAISGAAGVPDGHDGSLNNQARYQTRPESRTTRRWLDTGRISGANANYVVGFESVINVGSLNMTSEYLRNNVDRRDAVGEDVAFDGYYTQLSYVLTGEHHPWNRQLGTLGRLKPLENFFAVRDCECETQRGWGAWEVAARYSHADLNSFDILGGEANAFTFALNWYWNPYARVQFNYINGEIESGARAAGQGDYEILGVRWSVDF